MTNFKQLIEEAKANGQGEITITVNNRKEEVALSKVAYAMNFKRKNCRRVPKELDDRNIASDIIVDLTSTIEPITL